ncbi:hypothetical protein B0J13DRAFT_570371 [Dactylonectria estremocensis]|uniref:Homeobox domain-containing protein n=1 Tax=Dactylonectria estremocensis TaxID=1079267 RepID=A0A9P9DG24_9HYPO|nr:hypothetical protein B0J13DRAFT_570371 [Dactylonectria estremocensis]
MSSAADDPTPSFRWDISLPQPTSTSQLHPQHGLPGVNPSHLISPPALSEGSHLPFSVDVGKTAGTATTAVPAEVGARFSTGTIRVLKTWYAAHEDHYYPRSRDIQSIQLRTGLGKLQITTWLANTRRRTKSRIPTQPKSPGVPLFSTLEAMQIPPPQRPLEQMGPLQIWEHSPPEEDAADATAIFHAVSGFAGLPEGLSALITVGPQPSVRGEWSSASSGATSKHSGHSSGESAHSHMSGSSRASFYNSRPRKDVDGHLICAFRSELEPDQHVSTHNYNVCKDRSPEERLFYRKDHFIQHLKAAHNPNDNMPL